MPFERVPSSSSIATICLPDREPLEAKSKELSPYRVLSSAAQELDMSSKYMAASGAGTAIIAAIGQACAVPLTLSVGLTVGLGLGPAMWLGTNGLHALIKKCAQVAFPHAMNRSKEFLERVRPLYQELKNYDVRSHEYQGTKAQIDALRTEYKDVAYIEPIMMWVAFLTTVVAFFFLVNLAVGPIGILPFIGAVCFTIVLHMFMPKLSDVISYLKLVVRPIYPEREVPWAQRMLGRRVMGPPLWKRMFLGARSPVPPKPYAFKAL